MSVFESIWIQLEMDVAIIRIKGKQFDVVKLELSFAELSRTKRSVEWTERSELSGVERSEQSELSGA